MFSHQIETGKDYHRKAHEILVKKKQIFNLPKLIFRLAIFSIKFCLTISTFGTDMSFKIY